MLSNVGYRKKKAKRLKKNVHSKAYHRELSMARREGVPEEVAKERARLAGNRAVEGMA